MAGQRTADPGIGQLNDGWFASLGRGVPTITSRDSRASRFSQALVAGITDPDLRSLPLTGAIDQFADNTDLFAHRIRTRTMTAALTIPSSTTTT